MTAAIDQLHDWTANPSYVGTSTIYGATITFSGGTSSYDLRGTFDGAAYSLFEIRQRTLVSGVPVTSWTAYTTVGIALSNTVFRTFVNYAAPESVEIEIRLTSETVGTYSFTLSVHATGSATVQDSITFGLVIDEAAPELEPPVAVITASNLTLQPGMSATFYGTDSTDADGTIVEYAWEVEQPLPTPDPIIGSDDSITASFSAVGTYTVTLTVTDNDGLSDTTTVTVTVTYATVTEATAGQPILIRRE